MNEVEHIIKPAVRIADRPVVQFALHVSYPHWPPQQGPAMTVHRYSSATSDHDLLLRQSAGALRHVRGFPPLGLLRPLRPTVWPSADDAPTRPAAPGWHGRYGNLTVVPTFTAHRSAGEAPSYAPAISPRLRRRLSPWPPGRAT